MGLFSSATQADIRRIEVVLEDVLDGLKTQKLAVKKFRAEINALRAQLRETRENLRDVQSFLSSPGPASIAYSQDDDVEELENDEDEGVPASSREEQRVALGRYINGSRTTS